MIQFQRMNLSHKKEYETMLLASSGHCCEYSFANKYLWGVQQVAFLHGCVASFSHFYGRTVYPYPIGPGDKKAVLEALFQDAEERGIPCRLSCMTQENVQELESWFPGRFHIQPDRDSFDYVYAIEDLAELRGRKYQKKRNHYNRFRTMHPNYEVRELNKCNVHQAMHMINDWYQNRMKADPEGDYWLENFAMAKAFQNYQALEMEGILLCEEGRVLAVTMASRLSADTFDVHFEKAREEVDGAYNAVSCEFAQYLRQKYPEAVYLNREDDMGLEGLRYAKLSYNPHHLVEKYWARQVEDLYGG